MSNLGDKLAPWVGRELIFGIRPEHITDTVVSRHVDGVAHRRSVPVEFVEPTGPDTLIFMQLNGTRVAARVRPEQAQPAGSTMDFVFDVSKAVSSIRRPKGGRPDSRRTGTDVEQKR